MKKKVMIIAGFDRSLILFRRELIESWLQAGYEVTAAASGSEVRGPLKEMGVSYCELPLERTGLNPFKDLRLFFYLISLLRREQPDLLFLYTIKPVIYGSLAAGFGLREGQIISMITGLGYAFIDRGGGGVLRRLVIILYRLALRKNKKVFFQNPDDRAVFTELKVVDPDKIVMVNGSGVNLSYFRYVHPEKLVDGEGRRFLLIARLLREKGIIEYVEAARQLKQLYPETAFKLIGWDLGTSPSAIEQDMVEGWRREGVVEVDGEKDDVRPDLAEAHVYVLPSYREGTPRTVLEAMATGRAIITTDVPGCRETVEEGVNGFMVPVRDSDALAAAMERFITEPALAEQMGRESRKIAEEKFDVHKVNAVINREMGL